MIVRLTNKNNTSVKASIDNCTGFFVFFVTDKIGDEGLSLLSSLKSGNMGEAWARFDDGGTSIGKSSSLDDGWREILGLGFGRFDKLSLDLSLIYKLAL